MKTIVFVRGGPSLRIYNQALALKKSNKYRSILICKMMDKYSLSLFSKAFDKIIFYWPSELSHLHNRLDQIMKGAPAMYRLNRIISQFADPVLEYLTERTKLSPLIKKLDADAFNCIIRPYRLSAMVMKNTKKPIVFDAYDFDGIMHGIENIANVTYRREKYCFESASGVIHRGPEFEISYYKSHGYKITCPTLSFLDYCNREFFVNHAVKKLSSEDNEWHIVHIGSAVGTKFVSLLREAVKQKVHFHIYPTAAGMTPYAFKNILKLNKTEKYVHLEERVPFNRINEEIAKYDFGAHMHFLPMSPVSPMGLKVVHCHRVFNYLEAGLPVIVSDIFVGVKKTIVENSIGFSLKEDEFGSLRSMIEKHNYERLREDVLKAREELSIENHVERLVKFYNSVLEDAKK